MLEPPDRTLPKFGDSEQEMSPEVFGAVSAVLKEKFGFNLEWYKDKCVKRRIGIRIRATHSPSPEAYRELLGQSEEEQEHLLRVLTIHVSQFFRNPSTFAKLAREILPAIFKRHGDGEEVRIWSVGCAAGEEPYTLALMVKERFAAELRRLNISILGSDVDASVLKAARLGIFGPERVVEVKERQLQRWFTPVGGKFQLTQEIRDMVSLRQADLNDAASFVPSDLILCRNVLIYFERKHQETILLNFADALAGRGFLVLGKSETLVGAARRRFETVCPVERIYRAV